MNYIRHHSPDRKFRRGKVYINGSEPGCLRYEPDLVERLLEPSDQHFSVQCGDDHLAACCLDRPIYNDYVTVENAGIHHSVAVHPHEKSGGFVTDQLFIQV